MPRIAIIGSGFAGLGMAIRLKEAGVEDFAVLERDDDVGGTWRDNTYPGCACDVPSHLYSFSFAPNPDWSSTFSPQRDIQAYLQRCARDFGVYPHIRFGCEVTAAAWDDDAQLWRLETTQGEIAANVVVAAPGPLSEPSLPDVPGLDRFQGKAFHSARWDHDHDLDGERVAVIGTGASAIQFVPEIQPRVSKLHVFQRTPPWIVPKRARPLTALERRVYRAAPRAQLAMRGAIYWARESFVVGFMNPRVGRLQEKVAREFLHSQVKDPELRRKLTPGYRMGCKRVLISNDWYRTLTKPNVELVSDGIAEVRERSVVARDGTEREVDTLIFGTGFHVTDLPIADWVRGRRGTTLTEEWGGSPEAYVGSAVAGFPNLFFLVGPNTGLGHTSIVFMIESQVAYVVDALKHMAARGLASVEVREEVQRAYNAELQERLKGTVWNSGGCRSYYLDANGRNASIWPGFTYGFRRRTRRFVAAEYTARVATQPDQRVMIDA
jgi:cation diffusion facilitator CzcD-associated flavoprotein CzcO